MTRKHFEAIASSMREALAVANSPAERAGVEIAIHAIANVCAEFNGQFDRPRFETYSGLEE